MTVGWIYILFLAVFLPYAAWKGSKRFHSDKGDITRQDVFKSAILTQVILGGLAIAVAYVEHVELFPPPSFEWKDLWLAIAFLVPTLATIPIRWNWRSPEDKARTARRMPATAADLSWWSGVSLCAGFFEEIAYRGVLFALFFWLLGGFWPATLVCSVAFALAHWVQGWRSMGVIFVFAIANHLVVLATGDLYTMMAIHFVYDLLAGIIFMFLARKK